MDALLPRLDDSGNYTDKLVDILRDSILTGNLAPGEHLNEVQLSAMLGISRGPIREAIQKLVAEGLVRTAPHRGAYVQNIDVQELEHLYDMRSALESHAVRRAVKEVSEEQISNLSSLLAQASDVMQQNDGAYPEGTDFHHAIVALSGNPVLHVMAEDINRRIKLGRLLSSHSADRAGAALSEHYDILRAITARDAEGASTAIDAHFRNAFLSAKRSMNISSQSEPADEEQGRLLEGE